MKSYYFMIILSLLLIPLASQSYATTSAKLILCKNDAVLCPNSNFTINFPINPDSQPTVHYNDCGDNQIQKYQASNKTWICSTLTGGGNATALDDLGYVTITSQAYNHILQVNNLNQWVNKAFAINTQTATNGNFVTGINNQTGTITTQLFKINNQTTGSGDTWINGIDNQTGQIRTKQFSVNTKACSGTDKISSINNSTGEVTCTSDISPTILSADVTCTQTASYCAVWTIALTASKDHTINFNLSAESNTVGGAVQVRVRADQAGTSGFCEITHYTTSTAQVLDGIAIGTAPADDGETLWLPGANVPQPLPVSCAFITGATPGNLILEIQAEVASTVRINAGSNYIMTIAP